jgi:hypothetical protein
MSYLVDIKAIKKVAFTGGNVEDTMIASTLLRIQDIILQPILGTTFYKRLLQGVEDEDLNTDERHLINEYIFNVLVASVDLRILKPLSFKIKAKGAVTLRDEHATPLTNTERAEFEDELRNDLEVYKNSLIGYLKVNCTLFPEYDNWICSFENVPPTQRQGVNTNIRFV